MCVRGRFGLGSKGFVRIADASLEETVAFAVEDESVGCGFEPVDG
jgi:hypothetical protein